MKKESKSSLICSAEQDQTRLDIFFNSCFKSLSRTRVQELIKSGAIQIQNKKSKPSSAVSAGDKVFYNEDDLIEDTKEIQVSQKDISVEIVFEDNHILVVNKPAGLITHPGIGNTENSLVHAVFDKVLKNDSVRPGVVHRLDQETSGLLVLAKTETAYENLSKQFKEKTARRIYWALHFGRLKVKSGTWTSKLARHPKNRIKFSSQEDGREAVTHFKELVSGPISLTELALDTGRTHQIRVHLSEHNLPIVNDKLYGSPKNINSIQDNSLKKKIKEISRMALVARKLSFTHPATNELLNFETSWPEELDIL